MSKLVWIFIVIIFASVSACTKSADDKAPAAVQAPVKQADSQVSQVNMAQAKEIFQERCAVCHGENGAGDGLGAEALDPKPRNFHDLAWQTSVTDEHLEKIIKYGGAAVGKSPMMPSNPDLISQADTVKALRIYIRSLKDKN